VIVGQLKRYLGVGRIRLLDAPCGDLKWMSRFLQTRSDIDYTGVDIVDSLIENHRTTFADRPWKFVNSDIVSLSINVTDYDLIMTRMMMQHLALTDVISILQKLSNFTGQHRVFLLASTYSNTAQNNLHLNVEYLKRCSKYNLEIEPVRLVNPMCMVRDGPASAKHFVGLWRLPIKVIAKRSCPKPVANNSPLSELPTYSCTKWTLPST